MADLTRKTANLLDTSGAVQGYLGNDGTIGQSTALPYEPYGWQHSLRKLTTATEAVENPLYSDGTAITSYTIKGNTVQNGTPTPSAPISVNGVGNKTANLFDDEIASGYYNNSGELVPDTLTSHSTTYIPVDGTTYTISGLWTGDVNFAVYEWDSSKNWLRRSNRQVPTSSTLTFRIGSDAAFFTLQIQTEHGNIMLNTDSTALPFEPNGYKIPISSGGVTTNIYLGSTASNRVIAKHIFDGTEYFDVTSVSANLARFTYTALNSVGMPQSAVISTHYQWQSPQEVAQAGMVTGSTSSTTYRLFLFDEYTTLTEYRAYLAQQYANGTPVTVWYVLATAETAAVNEPLMKIGDYADSISNATAIPTTEGANSISVDTTVQPSEFTATWTGWHDASVKEYDGSDWQ